MSRQRATTYHGETESLFYSVLLYLWHSVSKAFSPQGKSWNNYSIRFYHPADSGIALKGVTIVSQVKKILYLQK